MKFLIDMLEDKKKHLEIAIQHVEAGVDNMKIEKMISKEIKSLEKRILDLHNVYITNIK